MLMPNLAQRIFNTPLLIHEGKLVAGLAAISGRFHAGGFLLDGVPVQPLHHAAFADGRPSLGVVGDRLGRDIANRGQAPYDMIDGVAVVGIEGTLVYKGDYVGMSSGSTSYQGLQTQVRHAMQSSQVKAVAFEVDSPGGEAAGAFETADMIAELSMVKPTIAIMTDLAASAGYLLASAARSVIVPESGRVGSIGAVSVHMDMSGALEQAGIKPTVLIAGRHKADGNPYEPLPDEVYKSWVSRLEETRTMFADAVGRYRGRRFTAAQAMATEAAVFSGREAVSMGLADATGHASEAFAAFLAEINKRSGL